MRRSAAATINSMPVTPNVKSLAPGSISGFTIDSFPHVFDERP